MGAQRQTVVALRVPQHSDGEPLPGDMRQPTCGKGVGSLQRATREAIPRQDLSCSRAWARARRPGAASYEVGSAPVYLGLFRPTQAPCSLHLSSRCLTSMMTATRRERSDHRGGSGGPVRLSKGCSGRGNQWMQVCTLLHPADLLRVCGPSEPATSRSCCLASRHIACSHSQRLGCYLARSRGYGSREGLSGP